MPGDTSRRRNWISENMRIFHQIFFWNRDANSFNMMKTSATKPLINLKILQMSSKRVRGERKGRKRVVSAGWHWGVLLEQRSVKWKPKKPAAMCGGGVEIIENLLTSVTIGLRMACCWYPWQRRTAAEGLCTWEDNLLGCPGFDFVSASLPNASCVARYEEDFGVVRQVMREGEIWYQDRAKSQKIFIASSTCSLCVRLKANDNTEKAEQNFHNLSEMEKKQKWREKKQKQISYENSHGGKGW